MAKKLIPARALPSAKSKKKSTAAETSSYWSGLNETVSTEETELMPQLDIHGIRRSSIRKRIF